jgi:hypothetical protein
MLYVGSIRVGRDIIIYLEEGDLDLRWLSYGKESLGYQG